MQHKRVRVCNVASDSSEKNREEIGLVRPFCHM